MRYSYWAVILSSFVFFACKKKPTTWSTEWKAPVTYDTLTLDKWVNDSTLAISNNLLLVDLTRTLLDIRLEDVIKIPDTTVQQSFNLTISLNNVPPGYSFVNDIQENHILLEPVQLKKVQVSQGFIKVKVYNPIGTKAFFTVRLPGVKKDGEEFVQTYFVDAGTNQNPGVAEAVLDVSGYTIDLTGNIGNSFNRLRSELTVKTDPDGPAVSVNTTNVFKVDASFKDIRINYAKGYFGDKMLSDISNFEVPYFSKIINGSLTLPETNLQFIVENGMKMAMKGTLLSASNTNYASNTVQLSGGALGNSFYLSPATGQWNTLQSSSQTISFNSSNSNISEYLQNLGINHQVAYNFQLNPWGNTSSGNDEIFPNSRIRLKVKAQLPMALSSDGLTLRDTFDLQLHQNTEKTHVTAGKLILKCVNAFPISAGVTLYLLDEMGAVVGSVVATSEISSSLLGSLDASSGLYKKASILNFELPENIVSKVNDIKKVVVEARFDTPDSNGANQIQTIPANAFLAVKVQALLTTKVVL